mmetsp:Transcript_75531/g.179428  ORF Transcript_75531/g.179428 Transcript_75531/m.179428 type:complete len:471 (+) Transcript_75531:66-1478(+)
MLVQSLKVGEASTIFDAPASQVGGGDFHSSVPFQQEQQKYHDLQKPGSVNPTAGHEKAFSLRDCPGAAQNIDALLRQPTIVTSEGASTTGLANEIVKKINAGQRLSVRRSWLGRMVPEGYVQFIETGGRTQAVASGRWSIPMWKRAGWGKMIHISEPRTKYGNCTIVWVKRGQLGFAWDAGAEVVLAPGLHVYNSPAFNFERFVDQNSDYLHHGTLHVVRVPRGKYGKAWVPSLLGGHTPRLLSEGVHVIESSFFKYEGLISTNDMHIVHGGTGSALHLIRVPEGSVAKISQEGRPMLLGSGYHLFETPQIQLLGVTPLSEKVISHGAIHLLRVAKGEVAVIWLNNEPLLLDHPGNYGFSDPDFKYVRHQPHSDKVIQLGAKKIVNVSKGEICMSHHHGALKVLEPGRHQLEDSAHTIEGFLSTDAATSGPLMRLLLGRKGWLNSGVCCSAVPQSIGKNYSGEEKWGRIS